MHENPCLPVGLTTAMEGLACTDPVSVVKTQMRHNERSVQDMKNKNYTLVTIFVFLLLISFAAVDIQAQMS